MTIQQNERVPEFTLGDRLRKARSLTGLTTREFAKKIGVSHGTITSAEGDKRAVRQITLNAWAMASGVSLAWLQTGAGDVGPTGGGETTPTTRLAELAASKRARHAEAQATRRYDQAA